MTKTIAALTGDPSIRREIAANARSGNAIVASVHSTGRHFRGVQLTRCTGDRLPEELNRAIWDERAPAHAASPDYGFDRFRADPAHLSDVVRFDLPRLGDLTGLVASTCSATSAPTRSRSSGSGAR